MSYSHRHLTRQVIIQAMYWHEANPEEDKDSLFAYTLDLKPGSLLTDTSFATETFNSLLEVIPELDKKIIEYAPQWPLDKISRIDLAILRLGIFELTRGKDIPPLVAINEAVELSKDFAGKSSAQFINGVLSEMAKAEGFFKKAE